MIGKLIGKLCKHPWTQRPPVPPTMILTDPGFSCTATFCLQAEQYVFG